MANHALTCPVCHSSLLIAHNTSLGGEVVDNLVLLDAAAETPAAAKGRTDWEAAVAAQEAAQKTLDEAAAATPVDDAKLSEANVALIAAQQATAAAEAAYAKARALPTPPAVGTLSPDGQWSWSGDEWQEVAKTPPPLPPGVVAETPAEEATEEAAETPAEEAAEPVTANG